ncbi:hypothetical protein QJS10_CPB20g01520 [Acorus calamus]|uniref:Uncharacterized protein n=1 Tax=Acorus calamus TaxID=4465 RepID=A0AAV9CBH9_ACOCL|nr:hypothetical protein QJS10_CPB20g01520 [Acorus calamus]
MEDPAPPDPFQGSPSPSPDPKPKDPLPPRAGTIDIILKSLSPSRSGSSRVRNPSDEHEGNGDLPASKGKDVVQPQSMLMGLHTTLQNHPYGSSSTLSKTTAKAPSKASKEGRHPTTQVYVPILKPPNLEAPKQPINSEVEANATVAAELTPATKQDPTSEGILQNSTPTRPNAKEYSSNRFSILSSEEEVLPEAEPVGVEGIHGVLFESSQKPTPSISLEERKTQPSGYVEAKDPITQGPGLATNSINVGKEDIIQEDISEMSSSLEVSFQSLQTEVVSKGSSIRVPPHEEGVRENTINAASKVADEKAAKIDYTEALQQEECFLRQKSRQNWLALGDRNSKFFYSSIQSRNSRNSISSLRNKEGVLTYDHAEIKSLIGEYYFNLLNRESNGFGNPYDKATS